MASVLRIVHIRKLHMKVLLAPQDGSGHSETQRAKRLLWSAMQGKFASAAKVTDQATSAQAGLISGHNSWRLDIL